MFRTAASNLIPRQLSVLPLIVLLLSSCLQEQPSGVEGTGQLSTPPSAPPPAHGGPTMATARGFHTATLLVGGKVLIAGGVDGGSRPLSSAELYDPSAGTFSTTGSMTTVRARHAAARLADGRVLIAGGWADGAGTTYVVSAEIYDPAAGTFAPTGNMVSNGRVASALLLADGRVLIAEDGNNAEVYDPATGTFALTGTYSTPSLIVDTAALLPNGTVLVVGCAAGCTAGTTEVFDPKTGSFSPTGPRLGWGDVSTATPLTDGTILFVEANEMTPDLVEIYDATSGTFTDIGQTANTHEFSTATRLPNGTVLVAGGQLPGGNGSSSVEVYLPATRTLLGASRLSVGRHEHTATLLSDGTVLIAGGFSVWPFPTASAEIYQ